MDTHLQAGVRAHVNVGCRGSGLHQEVVPLMVLPSPPLLNLELPDLSRLACQ